MLFQQAQHRARAAQDHAKAAQDQAKVANKLALQAEKDNDAAQKELQELQRVMDVSAVKGIFSSYSFLFFWRAWPLCHEKVQLLVQGLCTGAWAWG